MRRALVMVLVALVAQRAPSAAPRDRRLVNVKLGISVEAPSGWTLSTHTGYPNIVVLLLHPDGSRISIAADETRAKDARALAELSRAALEQQDVKILKTGPGPRDGVAIEGHYAGSGEGIVQLYIVRRVTADGPLQGIVVTLVARQDTLANQRTALDSVIATLGLNPPLAAPAATSTAAPRSSSAGERPAEKERR